MAQLFRDINGSDSYLPEKGNVKTEANLWIWILHALIFFIKS